MNGKVKGLILTLLLVGTFVTILTMTQVTAYTDANEDNTQEQIQNQNRDCICDPVCQNTCEEECTRTCRNEENGAFEYQHRNQTKHMNEECSSNQIEEMSQYGEPCRRNGKNNGF